MDGGAVMSASVAEFDISTHRSQQVTGGLDIAHLRDVFEDDWLVGQQGGGHAGKGGIFRAADADGAEQRLSAADDELIHRVLSDCKRDGSAERLTGKARWDRDYGMRSQGLHPLSRRARKRVGLALGD